MSDTQGSHRRGGPVPGAYEAESPAGPDTRAHSATATAPGLPDAPAPAGAPGPGVPAPRGLDG
ncbi:hypothetical protein ACFWUQ_23810, partial [Streptomyces sp. NPDC058662]